MKSLLMLVIVGLILIAPARAQYNDILTFRVLSESQNELVLDIQSYYTGSHGTTAYISVIPTVNGSLTSGVGYSAGRCPNSNNIAIGSNSTCMTLSSVGSGNQIRTDGLQVCMFGGPSRDMFHCEIFGHAKQWGSKPASQPPVQTSAPLPDLIITGVSWEPRSPVVPPGTTVRFSFQIRNVGNAPAHGFVWVFGPGNYSGGFPDGLNIGETKVAVINYPVYGQRTTHSLIFTVDYENRIQESNESNNSSGQYTIQTSY